MILLSDAPWGDFPTWVQAVIAIPMLIVAVITLLQEKKIKELTDVVIELRNQTTELKAQTQVLINRYELELLLSAKDRMPLFEMREFYKTQFDNYVLQLSNIGILATDLTLMNLESGAFVKSIRFTSGNTDIKSDELITFSIDCKQD